MNRIFFNLARVWRTLRFGVLAGLAAGFFGAGCHLPLMPNEVRDLGPRYHPSNFYRRADVLPPQIRRVAVLPLSTKTPTAFLVSGVETLEPVLYAELEKSKRFEVIQVTPDDMRQLTGKKEWCADDVLPQDFFKRIAIATGADAVLFSQLTRCYPYQPLAVGWKFCLISNPAPTTGPVAVPDTKDQILWAADEVIDAGEPGVANAARDYYGEHLLNEAPSAEATTILTSPARFGQYTLAALLTTMPERFGTINKR